MRTVDNPPASLADNAERTRKMAGHKVRPPENKTGPVSAFYPKPHDSSRQPKNNGRTTQPQKNLTLNAHASLASQPEAVAALIAEAAACV